MQEKEVKSCIKRVIETDDMSAFTQLVEAHKNRVYNLCLKMTCSAESAEEVAQDTFLKVYQSIKTFRGKSKFSTWLYKITYFTCLNYVRKNRIETRPLMHGDDVEFENNIIEKIQVDERQIYIKKAFQYLTSEEAGLMTFFYLEELSIEEITLITGLNNANVKTKLHRTRKKLHSILSSLLKQEIRSLLS